MEADQRVTEIIANINFNSLSRLYRSQVKDVSL